MGLMSMTCMKWHEGLGPDLVWDHHSVCVYTESKAEWKVFSSLILLKELGNS